MRYYFEGSTEVIIDLIRFEKDGQGYFVYDLKVKDCRKVVYVRKMNDDFFTSFDKVSWQKTVAPDNFSKWIVQEEEYKVFRGFKPGGFEGQSNGACVSKMPGRVLKVFLKEGDIVTKGDPLVIIEAMKMENEFKSDQSGKVKFINVKEGQSIEANHVMLEIEEIK